MRILLVSANRERLPSPVVPIGVLSVAASVRDAHDVRVVDLCFEDRPLHTLDREVRAFCPDLVGVGLRNLHTNAYDGTERLIGEYADVTRAIRGATDARLVLGGSGFSLRPTALLARLGADHGVVGEGERSFRALVDGLVRGETPPAIFEPVLPSSAVPLRSRTRPWSDLDLLPPPARDLCDPRYHAYDGTENIQTKRGCAFSCAYCDYPDLEGRKVRVRDPAAVADEVLAAAARPGVTHVFFVDSVFNVPRSHALAVCRELEARGAPLPWVCYATPAVFDDELAAAMARAGCVGVELGTDAGTERMLTRLKKPFSLGEVVRARDLCRAHGIHDCHSFVLGAEDETPEEAAETLAFVDRLDPDMAVFIVFMEDRESRRVHRAPHRDALLALLAAQAPKRPGWVVPELSIRFGERVNRIVERRGLRGPSWLHLAGQRRRERRGADVSATPSTRPLPA